MLLPGKKIITKVSLSHGKSKQGLLIFSETKFLRELQGFLEARISLD
jgi:hypothetical protein